MKKSSKFSVLKLLICVIGCECVGLLGTPFTIAAIPGWYITLNKPLFAPPNWIFGPVWTALYALMGLAFYLIWNTGIKKRKELTARNYFFIQLALNFIWTPFFFGLRSPGFGLVVIVAMWTFILLTIRAFFKISKPAAYLLIPYFIWVSFATILNLAIVVMN